MRASKPTYKRIPYGLANYKRIREENYYYVDKTEYLPLLEEYGNFLFLIRPRRFGKTSLLTVLESYYDIARVESFETLFKGTYIYDHPTAGKNAYLILKFNFSQVDPRPERLEDSFKQYINIVFFTFGKKYRDLLDEDYFEMMAMLSQPHDKLSFALTYLGTLGHQLYILLDEYDNFTNTILSTVGHAAYQELTHGTGMVHFFFNVLKGAVDQVDSGLGRMFITGVSPVTMDDVSSGFNIGTNISLQPEFNELLGFTKQQVRTLLTYYQQSADLEVVEIDRHIALLAEWCDNYRFAPDATATMFNTDMVLYLVRHLLQHGAYPDSMIDHNVRMDYGKLRHLMVIDRQLNGNFSYLRQILEEEQTKFRQVADSFPVEHLTRSENFISLLYYFGLLSYNQYGRLGITNRTVKQLMYSYLRAGFEDVEVFNVDLLRFSLLMRGLAFRGEWQSVFQFLADEVEKQTAIRDYLTGEKVIQTFLLAYLSFTDYYLTRTEAEMGKGFVDLYLEPFWTKYPQLPYSYLIELKYIKRAEFSETLLNEKLAEAKTQLQQYTRDPHVVKRTGAAQLIRVALVFAGWELKGMQAV